MSLIIERALSQWLDENKHNEHNTTTNDETEGDRASLQETVQNLTKEIEHLKGIVKPQEELLAVTGTDKPRPTASLNTPPKSFGFAVHSLLKEAEEGPIDLSSDEVGEARSPSPTPLERKARSTPTLRMLFPNRRKA